MADLTRWTERHFPGAERTHIWSAQDYQPHNYAPFVGQLPRGRGRVYLATGYNKWGMTNAVAAALRISAELLGGNLPWAKTLSTRVSKPASAVQAVQANLAVGAAAVNGWLGAELRPLADADRTPPEGEGVVGNVRGAPVASPPWTAGPARSPRSAPTWVGCCGSTTSKSPGTARCTDPGSPRTGPCSRDRPPRTWPLPPRLSDFRSTPGA